MSGGYPFNTIVRDRETGNYISLPMLERAGAPVELVQLVVTGPLEDAIIMMAHWSLKFEVVENGLDEEDRCV
jgi:hypothetical protein